ncbi:MAG: DUF3043 domain-containing protein [Salinibacterium sp.]|nr:MAG: DUF3043 domain-containing protein [Salinibacterium sp.]
MAKKSTDEASNELDTGAVATGKGRPTPTRREKEDARKQPLVGGDRTAARQQSRELAKAQREKQRAGALAGDDRYLSPVDRGPQRRFAREYVDARFSIAELMVPLLIFAIILSFVRVPKSVLELSTIVFVSFFVVLLADCFLLAFRLRRKLAAKYGAENVQKVGLYASMRALTLPILRVPRTKVRRGQYPE